MKPHPSFALLCAFALAPALLAAKPPGKTVTFTEQELRAYDATQAKLDPEKKPLLPQLRVAFPGQQTFTEHEIAALTAKGKKLKTRYHPENVNQNGRRIDAFTTAEADSYLASAQTSLPTDPQLTTERAELRQTRMVR